MENLGRTCFQICAWNTLKSHDLNLGDLSSQPITNYTRFIYNIRKHDKEWNEACHLLDSFFLVVVPTAPFSSFSTIMMNISSWLPYLNFRSNILSIYFPHTSWFFGMNRNLMVGAIYHRLITTTRKRADVDEDQYCGQLPTNILIQIIINLVFQ